MAPGRRRAEGGGAITLYVPANDLCVSLFILIW